MSDNSSLAGQTVPAQEYAALANEQRDLIDLVIEADRSNTTVPSVPTARPLSLNDDVESVIDSALDQESPVDPWVLLSGDDETVLLDTAEGVCANHDLPTIVFDFERYNDGDLAGVVVHDEDGTPTWEDGVLTRALYHAMNGDIAVILHNIDQMPPTAKDGVRTFFVTNMDYDYLDDRVPGINPVNLLKIGEPTNVAVIATATGDNIDPSIQQQLVKVDL